LFGIYAASIVADDNRCCSCPAQGQFVVTRRLVVRCDRSHPRGESPRGAGLNVGDGFATPCRCVIASQVLPKRVFGKQNENQVIDFSMLRFRVRDLLGNRVERISPLPRSQGFVVDRRHSTFRRIAIVPSLRSLTLVSDATARS
jgi:hypothetical protein